MCSAKSQVSVVIISLAALLVAAAVLCVTPSQPPEAAVSPTTKQSRFVRYSDRIILLNNGVAHVSLDGPWTQFDADLRALRRMRKLKRVVIDVMLAPGHESNVSHEHVTSLKAALKNCDVYIWTGEY